MSGRASTSRRLDSAAASASSEAGSLVTRSHDRYGHLSAPVAHDPLGDAWIAGVSRRSVAAPSASCWSRDG